MVATLLEKVRIVLVEPAGPLNVGAVARVMKNMGLQRLVLVNPQCNPQGDEARRMAVHAGDVLAQAEIVMTVPEALKGCQRAIATSGRPPIPTLALEHPRVALPWLVEAGDSESQSALIFGREDRGLTSDELNYAQRLIQIPSSPAYPSLNLAQAVGICCYELSQIADQGELGASCGKTAVTLTSAPLQLLEAYYQHLEKVLLEIGYLYPHTANSRMQKFRRLFNRALPTTEEVALLRGILSQVSWATQVRSREAEKGRSAPGLEETKNLTNE